MKNRSVRELSVEEIKKFQDKMLEIFLYFKGFCEEYNLIFFMIGGCAIGTVRHHGFIPWDDDIDCGMPREDYERFAELWDKYGDKERYTYCRSNRNENYHHCCASLRDNNTTFINRHSVNDDVCHGMALEFGPYDGRPNNKLLKARQVLNQFTFAIFNFQRLPDNKGRAYRVLAKLLYGVIKSKKLRDNIWLHCEKQIKKYKWKDCDYIAEMIGMPRVMVADMPKCWFNSVVYMDFEGYKVPMMVGYDEYLRFVFGDYMKLPPKEKRVAKHDTVYMSITEPYIQFKGIYYCVNKGDEKK